MKSSTVLLELRLLVDTVSYSKKIGFFQRTERGFQYANLQSDPNKNLSFCILSHVSKPVDNENHEAFCPTFWQIFKAKYETNVEPETFQEITKLK